MISRKAKYGLLALQLLTREYQRGPLLVSELSEQGRIPRKFLEAILLQLKHAGLLQSHKGRGGGYSLIKQPAEIRIGEVIRILEGSLAPGCVSENAARPCPECHGAASCGIRLVMQEVGDALARILDATSLLDMQNRSEAAARQHLGIVDFQI